MDLKVRGQQIAEGKINKNKYATVVIEGKTTSIFFPNNIPVAKGEILNGTVNIGEKTYTTDKDGKDLAEPFTRWEVTAYISNKVRLALMAQDVEELQLKKQLSQEFNLSDADITALATF